MTQASAREQGRPDARPPDITQGVARTEAGAVLGIDLGAIRENFRRLKRRLGRAACGGVAKADAYGLGVAPVCIALAREGCAAFFVAHCAEGVTLRAALGAGPEIYVLNGLFDGAEPVAIGAGLTPVLNSPEQLKAWRAAAGKNAPAALQVDTGMARIGMAPADFAELTDADLAGLDLKLVMSHLACADEPDNPANGAQRRSFQAARARFPQVPASLANSSGIFLGREYHFDLARPGAALYGVNPTPGAANPMAPVVRLEAKVIQTRTLPPYAGVGYGHAFHTTGTQRVATIALGYADGWHRRTGGAAWFEETRLPILGRVSMDSIILDVSALPAGMPRPGDLVEMIGPHQGVDAVAEAGGTIGYEVLTSLANRFHRIYSGG
jgi:alanine racemase